MAIGSSVDFGYLQEIVLWTSEPEDLQLEILKYRPLTVWSLNC